MTRKQAINLIRVEVAQEGRITREALRYYLDVRMSRETFNKAAQEGFVIYNRTHAEKVYEDANAII